MQNFHKFSVSLIAFTGAIAGLSSPADAQEVNDGFYLSASAGINVQSDHNLRGTQAPDPGVPGMAGAPANVFVDYDNGVNLTGSIGYRFKKGFISFLKPRVELEVAYSEADVGSGNFNGGAQTFSGSTDTLFVKVAFFSDIIWKENQKIIPYFGSGYGIGIVDTNILYFPNASAATSPTVGVVGSRTGFARHNSLGLTIKASDKFDIYAEGRYSRVSRRNFDRRFLATNGLNARVRDNSESLAFSIGARARF